MDPKSPAPTLEFELRFLELPKKIIEYLENLWAYRAHFPAGLLHTAELHQNRVECPVGIL